MAESIKDTSGPAIDLVSMVKGSKYTFNRAMIQEAFSRSDPKADEIAAHWVGDYTLNEALDVYRATHWDPSDPVFHAVVRRMAIKFFSRKNPTAH